MDATSNEGAAETLCAMASDAQKHGVSVTPAWLNEVLHVNGEDDTIQKVSDEDLAEEIAGVYESNIKDEDTECNGV